MKTTGLNFIEAVQAVKDGHRIRREGWKDFWSQSCNDGMMSSSYAPYNVVIPQQDDILANDWVIIPMSIPPKQMNFLEATLKMQEGCEVTRLGQADKGKNANGIIHIQLDYPSCPIRNRNRKFIGFSDDDIAATDWIVVDD
jgi:hypothetical protein